VEASMAHDWSVSEGSLVLLLGSKLAIWKSVAFREEVRRNLLSGYVCVKIYPFPLLIFILFARTK
jgi:hypothetical protein